MELSKQKHDRLPERPSIDGPKFPVVKLRRGNTDDSKSDPRDSDDQNKPRQPPDVTQQFKHNARIYQAQLICKKAAAIEYSTNPSVYVEFFGDDLRWAIALLESSGGVGSGTKYIWCTINPEYANLDLSVEEQCDRIITRFRKLIGLTWVKRWWLAIEQRNSLPDDPNGLHAHFIIDRGNYEPSRCDRDITRIFRDICGHSKHIMVVNLKEKFFMQKYRYLCGQKTEDQHGKDELDRIMRKDFEIPALMTHDNPGIVDENYANTSPRANSPRSDDNKEEESDNQDEGSEASFNGEVEELSS